jgi:hypothetical protein
MLAPVFRNIQPAASPAAQGATMRSSLQITMVLVGAALAFGCGSKTDETGSGGSKAAAGSNTGGAAGGGVGGGGGDVGSGGTTTVADSGTGGSIADAPVGPAGDKCFGRGVVAAGTTGLIDDFEDHDLTVLANDGRKGRWGVTGDPGCTITPSPLLPQAPGAGKTVNNGSNYALHVSGTGCTAYGMSVGTELNLFEDTSAAPVGDAGPPMYFCGYDLSKYDGVYFWGLGEAVQITIQVALRTTIPMSLGGDGSCEKGEAGEGCYDHYLMTEDLTADWALYSFPWDDLLQGGWGTKAALDVKQAVQINFAIARTEMSPKAEIWLDNVGLYKGTPPTTAP